MPTKPARTWRPRRRSATQVAALPLRLAQHRGGGEVRARGLTHHEHARGIAAERRRAPRNPPDARADVLNHVPDGALREVSVVQTRHDETPRHERLRQERAPGFIPDDPHSARHKHDHGSAFTPGVAVRVGGGARTRRRCRPPLRLAPRIRWEVEVEAIARVRAVLDVAHDLRRGKENAGARRGELLERDDASRVFARADGWGDTGRTGRLKIEIDTRRGAGERRGRTCLSV